MNGRKYQFDNPRRTNFRGSGHVKLHVVCPNCKPSNLAAFKFSEVCGHNLTIPVEP